MRRSPLSSTSARSLLLETGQSIIAYGIVIVIAAWLAGPTGWATSIRHAITPHLRQPSYAYGGLAVLLRCCSGGTP